jgi:hypothetical protein
MSENHVLSRLFALLSLFVFSISALILSIFNYNPGEIKSGQFTIFYISLFITSICILTLIQIFVRYVIFKNYAFSDYFIRSIRISAILSLAITSSAILRGLRVLDLWITIPIFLAAFLVELFFRTKPKVNK